MKRLLYACVIALLSTVSSMGEPIAQLKPTDYVNDFAHVLNSETVAQLDDLCAQIDHNAHAQIAVVTINTLDGNEVQDYANQLFKQWGVGAKATDHGVLILVAVQDHRYWVEVGYGLEPILPDGKVGGFGRQAVPLLKQNDYNSALLLLTSDIAGVIAQDAGVKLTQNQDEFPLQGHARHDDAPSPISIVLIIIVIIIVLFVPPLRRLLFWMLIFGGGSSGGGGAGGSW